MHIDPTPEELEMFHSRCVGVFSMTVPKLICSLGRVYQTKQKCKTEKNRKKNSKLKLKRRRGFKLNIQKDNWLLGI